MYATEEVTLQIKYSGGLSSKKNEFGVYTYPKSHCKLVRVVDNPSVKYTKLFDSNDSTIGSTAKFTVPKDHYFGYYMHQSKTSSGKYNRAYYSENRFNEDNGLVQAQDIKRPDHMTDHFLILDSTEGLNIMIEDAEYFPGEQTLGNQNYSTLLFNQLKCADGRKIKLTNVIDSCMSFSGQDAGLESKPIDIGVAYNAQKKKSLDATASHQVSSVARVMTTVF